jgi:hypothetical protein
MSGFDFFVDLMVTGTVLGLDDTSEIETVHAVFGQDDFLPPLDSFGLIEFGWYQHKGRWEVTYFGAQAHRLRWLTRDTMMEPALIERYGEFPDRIDVDELLVALSRQGIQLEELPYHDEDYVDLWSPVTRMGVLADRSSRSVEKMLGRSSRNGWRSFPGRQETFTAYAKHLLTLTDTERQTWYDRRDPQENRADWWRCLSHAAAGKTGGTDETALRWARLRLALVSAAAERGALPPDEAAVAEVELLADAAENDLPLGTADCTADDAVARWLATLPASPAGADLPTARLLRDQIHDVQRGLGLLTDPGLAEELRRWMAVKPLLLADRPTG